ncbi:MAG: glycerol-3-phosphate 1-O-acyltransferase PlsY [Schaedlerella sp.]|nr:glycerol-3-phosphate 1-O-acyltransferase PlsY [Schaedlerella sp.]
MLDRVICLAIGYVFGLIQTGTFMGKLHNVDLRKEGSGNSGATNTLRVLGVKAGAITFAGDVLKCVLAVVVSRMIFKDSDCMPLLSVYACAGTTLGHNYPFYLKFKGGKGIAVFAGMVLMTGTAMIPIPLLAFLITVIFTRYVSLGSMIAYVMFLCEVILFGQMGGFGIGQIYLIEMYAVIALLTALAWYRHKANIVRLLAGTENKIGSKKK